jgi:predicted ATP-dependent serine protease
MTDRWLGCGLVPGSVVELVGDPGSPTEELLYPAVTANPSRYLSVLPAPG